MADTNQALTAPAVTFESANSVYRFARLSIETQPDSRRRAWLTQKLEGWYRGAMEFVTDMTEPTTSEHVAWVAGFHAGKSGRFDDELLSHARHMRKRVRALH